MIHVGFNGGMLGQRQVGLGKYAFELLKHLRPVGFEVTVFIRRETDGDGLPIGSGLSVTVVPQPFSTGNAFIDFRLWEGRMFLEAKRRHFDVFHSPYFVCSPYRFRAQVVTLADAIQYIFPQYVTSWPRELYWSYNARRLHTVQHVVTLSEHSKKDILRLFEVSSASVEVIYPGVADRYKPEQEQERLFQISEKYALPKRFILYVGGFDVRKNVEALIAAYNIVRKRQRKLDIGLVLVGPRPKPIPGLVPDVTRYAEDLGLGNRVVFTGPIPEEHLPALYRLSDVLVYPSLYEGFGMPLVEAMSCGTPVLTSNASSIPEIVTRPDILFDPRNFEEIADRIERMVLDSRFRSEVAQWGLDRAKSFKWETVASQIAELYLDLARGAA
jgi:glycosyltransferase involved in cell wall biosynthesis